MAETVYRGLGISDGTAIARVCLFDMGEHLAYPRYKLKDDDEIARELVRLDEAIKAADGTLADAAARAGEVIGRAEAQIFNAQRAVLEDETLLERMRDAMTSQRTNAESAVATVFSELIETFAKFDNVYMSERGGDIGEVRGRLLAALGALTPSFRCVGASHCQKGSDRVVVTRELMPMLTVELDVEHVRAFVTEHGGKLSHAAILARSLGIPAVSGIKDISSTVSCGTLIAVDGTEGLVYVDPDPATVKRFTEDTRAHAAITIEPDFELPELPVKVEANINGPTDARVAVRMGADGVGLFRTEFVFMRSRTAPDEKVQRDAYCKVFEELGELPAVFRLLDIGGDKPLPYLEMADEDNPYLGFRGARLLLGKPELFAEQVKAIASCNTCPACEECGRIGVMYPMVSGPEQLLELKELVADALGPEGFGGAGIREGVMFEVPSACLRADEMLEHVDFGSIGTNDLTQYTLAVDRDNASVAGDFNAADPAVWMLIERVVEAGKAAGKPIGVCGEVAGEPELAVRLARMGVTSLSVSPRLVPRVKGAIAEALSVGQLEAKAE